MFACWIDEQMMDDGWVVDDKWMVDDNVYIGLTGTRENRI